jgi:integrase
MRDQSTPRQSEGNRDTRTLTKTGTPGIFKRGPGSYVVVYRDTTGKQRKKCARTLAEARTVKSTLTADVKRGEYMEESRIVFADYAATWIQTYGGRTSRGIRPVTLADYRRSLGLDAEGKPTGSGAVEFFGRTPLRAIRPQDVKRYASSVASRGVARNTVRLAVAPVRALLATAFEEGLIRSNPAAGLRLAHVARDAPESDRVKAMSEDELRRLLAEIPDRHRLLVEFLAQTGLRISEALALTKADIDFGRRRVMVRRRLYAGELAPPKTKHGRRDVPLSPTLAQRLWTLLAREPDETVIFTGDRSKLYAVVRAAGERAGVPWVGLHSLRHTCASILFRRGLNAKQVQAWLGHHSAAFTLSTYVHLIDDDLPDPVFWDEVTDSQEDPAATVPLARWTLATHR